MKKFTQYFLELAENPKINQDGSTSRYMTRSKKAVDRLMTLRRAQMEQFIERESEKLRGDSNVLMD